MKTVALGVLIGIVGTTAYFLMNASKHIEYVAKPYEVIKEVYIEKPIEVEKIIFKKRSCPKLDLERVCSEYASSLQATEDTMLSENKPEEISISVYTLMPERKNRVNFLVGYGKTGYSMNYDGQSININPEHDWNLGLQFERKLTDRFNGNILIQTNKNVSIGFGYDF